MATSGKCYVHVQRLTRLQRCVIKRNFDVTGMMEKKFSSDRNTHMEQEGDNLIEMKSQNPLLTSSAMSPGFADLKGNTSDRVENSGPFSKHKNEESKYPSMLVNSIPGRFLISAYFSC